MDIDWNKKTINNFKRNDGQITKIINNFEIIEIRLAIQLLKGKKENKENKNNLLIGRFYFIKNKILAIFKDENSFYFQIGFINDQNTFIVEYILDIDYDKNKIKNLIDFDKSIININKEYFLKEIFNNNGSNSFVLDNNIKVKLYNISNNNSNQNLLDSLNGETRVGVDAFKDSQKNDEKNEEEKLKKYLEILLIFYKIELDFNKNLNQQHYLKDKEEYFIINEEWILLFRSNSHYKEILKSIKDHFNNIDNIEQIVNDFFKNKRDNITPHLNSLKSLFENNLAKLYEINNNPNNNDKFKNNYYYNFSLINQNFIDILKNLNINEENFQKAKCIFLEHKILVVLKNKEKPFTLNIGKYKDNLFITEIIINSQFEENIGLIIDTLKSNRYDNYLNYLKFDNDVDYQNNNIQIISISKKLDQYNPDKLLIGSKLKAFILLNIYLRNIIQKTMKMRSKMPEEVYLLSLDSLNICGYEEINKIVNKNITNDLMNLENFNNNKIINDFILKLNSKEIKEKDKNLQEMDYFSLFANSETLELLNHTKINYCNNFILCSKEIIKLFYGNLKEIGNPIPYKFYSGNNINILVLFEKNNSSILLIGSILNSENLFKLEYIFDYKNTCSFYEINEIYSNYENYFNKKLLFNKNSENDCISPIFNNDSIIGYAYKYNQNLLMNNYNFLDFSNINKDLINMIHLYSYYYFFKKLINNSDKYKDYQLSSNDYCIVNSIWMNQIKTFYKFDLISNNLKSNKEIENILERNQENNSFKLLNLKNIYKIIKQIPSDNFEKLNFKSDKEYFNSNSYDVEVNQVKKAENEFFFVYINFEILNRNIVQLFQTEINHNENNFSEIIINDKNIIINLPKNFYGFSQYIAMIGKVNDYTFINDYILVYHHQYQGQKIYKIIKNGLNEFLNKFQNNDFFVPIMDDDSDDVLGEIIKHNKKKDSDNNFINKEVDINNNDEYNLNPPHNRIVLIEKNFINNVPLIGLENIGATCYMNATLQCFCHIKKFVNKFKYAQAIIDKVRINNKNLTAAFKLLIEKL